MSKADLPQDELHSYLRVIRRNSTQLLRIIDDILDLSKVEAGRMDIEKIEFSLQEVLADAMSMLGLRARENSIAFVVEASTPIPSLVISDPTRLRQILVNVVGNAIKFTAQGTVRLLVAYRHGLLEFVVVDTGCGVSAEQAKKLFQPFTQADASTTRKFGGTGLGLTITKSLCESMGGHFLLRASEPGLGSTFVACVAVELPENVQFLASLTPRIGVECSTIDDSRSLLSGMKILLVEDSPDNRHLIHALLSRAGASVELASDGLMGVTKSLSNVYDVVLMDIQMPHMDGIEAIKLLRAKNYTRPVIALTAHAMKEHEAQALRSGFNGFLTKPVQADSLIATLKAVCLASQNPATSNLHPS